MLGDLVIDFGRKKDILTPSEITGDNVGIVKHIYTWGVTTK